MSLWPRTRWQQSRPYRQQSTLLPICCRFRQQSTFNKVDRIEFNFVASVYRALEVTVSFVKVKRSQRMATILQRGPHIVSAIGAVYLVYIQPNSLDKYLAYLIQLC